MAETPNFDLKQNFPIAGVAQLYADKRSKEEAIKHQQFQDLMQGLDMFSKGVGSLVERRNKIAQAGLQADILMKNPEIVAQMGDTQVGSVTPPASPGMDGMPIPNVAPQPVMTSSIPANMKAMRDRLAGAIQGTGGDDFLKLINPQNVQETVYQKDAAGNIIGTTTRSVPKGSKSTVVGPQPVQQPRQPVPLSPDRAEIQIIDKFNGNPQVRRLQQSLDGASAVRELALSGNPIAAAAIPTYMARASGEVGNLSEPDKAPFGGTREILGRLEASLKQLAQGTLTTENKQFLIDLSDVMEKNANKNLDRKGREYAKQYSSTKVGLKADEIFTNLRPDSKYKEEEKIVEPESRDVLKVGGTFNGQRIVGVKLKKQ